MIKSSGSRKNSRKNPMAAMLALIGFLLAAIMLLQMGLLWIISKTDSQSNPIVLIYGSQGEFSSTILHNTLHSAGFDYSFISDRAAYDDSGNLRIPNKYLEEDIILLTMGDKAFDSVTAYRDGLLKGEAGEEFNILGFVMLEPKFPGNIEMEGINKFFPEKDVAIFTGKDNTTDVSSLSDGRLIYERMSGDDTLYGPSIMRGNIFPSKCFISLNQNRYLSISSIDYKDGMAMLVSPLFQSEFAGYLSSVYHEYAGRDINYFKINSFIVMTVGAVFFFIVGISLYLLGVSSTAQAKRKAMSRSSEKQNESKAYVIVSTVCLLIYASLLLVSGFVPFLRNYYKYMLLATPVCLLLITAIMAVGVLGKTSTSQVSKTDSGNIRVAVILGVLEVTYIALIALIIGNYTTVSKLFIPIAFLLAVIDGATLAMSSYGQRIGADTFFGKWKVLLLLLLCMVIPTLIHGIMGSLDNILIVQSLVISCVPLAAVLPIKRHSDNAIIQGIVHGLIYLILLLWIG